MRGKWFEFAGREWVNIVNMKGFLLDFGGSTQKSEKSIEKSIGKRSVSPSAAGAIFLEILGEHFDSLFSASDIPKNLSGSGTIPSAEILQKVLL